MQSYFRTFLLMLICFSILSACGGGDDSEESSNELGKLSFTALPTFPEANENQTATFTLDVSGKGSDRLNFDWEVTYLGEDLTFTGQNTDTISFVTPEVTGNKPVYVSVDFDLNEGTLLGPNSDSTSLTIIDLDPAPEPAELGKNTDLLEVDALSLDLLPNNSTWRLVNFETGIMDISSIESKVNLSNQRIVYLFKDDTDTLKEEVCGVGSVQALDAANFGSDVSCDEGTPLRKFYQNTNAFRMEISCANEVLYASEYSKISDEKQINFGSLEIDFEFQDSINLSENVCGTTAISQIIAPASSANPAKITTSTLKVFGEYLSEPLNIVMIIDGPVEFGASFFSDFFDPYNINSVTIKSSELPALDGLKMDEDGDITLLTSSIKDIEGNFDADIIDLVGAEESIDASFELRFE